MTIPMVLSVPIGWSIDQKQVSSSYLLTPCQHTPSHAHVKQRVDPFFHRMFQEGHSQKGTPSPPPPLPTQIPNSLFPSKSNAVFEPGFWGRDVQNVLWMCTKQAYKRPQVFFSCTPHATFKRSPQKSCVSHLLSRKRGGLLNSLHIHYHIFNTHRL